MIKLPKLPDRQPLKVSISISPDLHEALQAYAKAYGETYGREEPVTELIPAIVASFLDSDRGFAKTRSQGARTSTR